MDKILVIGASGKIGKKLVKQLAQEGQTVRAMVRTAEKQQEIDGYDAEVVIGDLEGAFEHALEGCDTIIFTAGSGGHTGADKTLLVDLWGAMKVIDCAVENSIRHFIMVSSRGADNPENGPVAIKYYLVAKHVADDYLTRSGLTYTILRPGRLLDEPGTGLITTLRPADPNQQIISRDDTAQAVIHCLHNAATENKIFELYRGDVPTAEALR